MSITSGIGLRRIDHVGIAVPDLDQALELYVGTLGGECTHTETNSEQGVSEAMVAWPDGSSQVQLLAPLDENSTIQKFLDRQGPGLQQLAFEVEDIDHACAVLRDKGVRLLFDEPKTGTGGSRINFAHPKDVGGVLVELVEPVASTTPH
ncbi:methylmalonyl-CoA epimerase [Natronoglycomyces albus]|uniref:Methylmalonyl-CoA epimerase n=1 Tax=Natronoglycomyces albus TaxID=2811108 RepID=A0A895XKX8_9ACTN|nr:methylmalonyl-CoA epimerase [Natronoglycomyces albus]QSB05984.1 methylmalonyl-CoA epimerase [Natronoglycomyces albus]